MLPVLRRRNGFPAGLSFVNDFDRFFNVALGDSTVADWSPAVDVIESEDEFLLSAELPGLTADDVEITVEDGVLSITGEKREFSEENDERVGRRIAERRYGKFVRTYTLPRSVDGATVKAGFDNGILSIHLPKSASAKPRQIKIK